MNPIALFQIEFIKTSRRTAFWVVVGIFLVFGIATLSLATKGSMNINGQPITAISLPDGWSRIASTFSFFIAALLPITIILLSTSEFTFKTTRQNIIDGLTRESFFTGKIILALLITFAYWLLTYGLGFVFGLQDKPADQPYIRSSDAALIGASFVTYFGYAAIGLFFAFLTKSSGPAIGLYLLYTLIIEKIAHGLIGLSDAFKSVGNYFPTYVFDDLTKALRYDAEKFKTLQDQLTQARTQLESMKSQMPEQAKAMEFQINQAAGELPSHDSAIAFALALGYIALILGATYFIFKKRDL